jgi:O-antigen ligase
MVNLPDLKHAKSFLVPALLTGGFTLTLFMQGYRDIQYFPALILLSLALLITLLGKTVTVPTSFPALCVILLWSLAAIAFSFSTIPFTSQIAFLIFSALPITFLVTYNAVGQDDLVRPLIILAGIVFAVLSACAVFKNIFIPTGSFGARAHWPFINPNSLATILMVGLIPLAGCALGCAPGRTKNILSILGLLVFAGLVATGSRGGFLAAVIGLGVLFYTNRHTFTLRSLAPVGGAAAAIAVIMPLISGQALLSGYTALTHAGNPSVVDRLSLWQSAWKMMMDHPVLGTGPGTFSAYYPAYREAMVDQSTGKFAHFDALQMGVEMGVLAPILIYAMMIAVLIRTISAVLAAGDNAKLRLRILTPFAALLALGVHAHICFPLFLMPVLIACGVLLALWHLASVEALHEGHNTLSLDTPRTRLAVLSGGVVIAALMMALSMPVAMGSHYMKKALNQKDPQAYLQTLAKADQVGPENFIDPEIEMARINLRLLNDAQVQSVRLRQQYLDETEILLSSAESWNPLWPEIDFLRGQLRILQGRGDDAIIAWEAAIKKDPMHFASRKALAEHLARTERRFTAGSIVTEGLKYPHPMIYREWATQFMRGTVQ